LDTDLLNASNERSAFFKNTKNCESKSSKLGIDGDRVRLVASHDIPQAAPTFSELAAEASIYQVFTLGAVAITTRNHAPNFVQA
jgi:hypothetical protein